MYKEATMVESRGRAERGDFLECVDVMSCRSDAVMGIFHLRDRDPSEQNIALTATYPR